MGGHKGAFSLSANQQVVVGQFINGLSNRALTDSVARGQFHLAGNAFHWFPFACLKALQDQPLDLLIKRAERWRRR